MSETNPPGCPNCGFVNPAGFKFCGQCGTALSSVSADKPELEAERRHLTVLFCDLVDSSGWSQRLDPEEYRQLLSHYRTICNRSIKQYGGSNVRYVGDGIRVYFGYPQAHEDDAERSVRAGLAMIQEFQQAPFKHHVLQVRIGIATGIVVAGRIVTEAVTAESEAVGDTPNLAARIQGLGQPDTVLITETTRALLGSLFQLEDLGEHQLKGFTTKIRVWQVLGESSHLSRFIATRNRLMPLVNREQELAALTRCWSKALAGQGQLVLLKAEPGMGKSRLIEEVRSKHLGHTQATTLYYQCSPYHSDSALYPIRNQLQFGARIQVNDSLHLKRAKLREFMARAGAIEEQDFIFIASLLGLLREDEEPEQTPARRKTKLFEALIRQLKGLAQQQTVLVIFEDVHWIDESTLELLQQTSDTIRSLSVLMVLTTRPEFSAPWLQDNHITCLELGYLDTDLSQDLARQLAGGKNVPPEILDYINTRASGNPFHIEELTRTILQDESLVYANTDAYHLVNDLPEHAVPASLHDLLLARLDKLSPVKVVAQTAAVIGREFTLQLLAAVSDMARQTLGRFLQQLIDHDVLVIQQDVADTAYSFRHVLLQEAAYESLLLSRRQHLHLRIAQTMEQDYPHLWRPNPDLLAYHFNAAEQWQQAAKYWLQAGTVASDASAYTEALNHLDKALQAVAKLSDKQEKLQLELDIQTCRGGILINTAGGGAAETVAAYQRAMALSQILGDSKAAVRSSFAALWGLWRTSTDLNLRQSICDQMLQLAQSHQDQALLLQAYHVLWPTSFSMGNPVQSLQEIQQGLAHYPANKPTGITEFGGHDAKVCAHAIGGLVNWLAGYPQEALVCSRQAMLRAQELQHAASLVHALDCAITLAMFQRNPKLLLQHAKHMQALCDQHGLSEFKARVRINTGWAKVVLGTAQQGVELMEDGLAALHDLGTSESHNYYLEMLAYGYQQLGQIDSGLSILEQALALEHLSICDWAAEVRRRQARLLTMQGASASAYEVLQQAMAIAQQQQARSLQLRIAFSLAKLPGAQVEARDQLAAIYATFDEGFDSHDLIRVRQFLQQLS